MVSYPPRRLGDPEVSFLQSTVGATVGVRPYTARELSVREGQEGEVLQGLDGWVYVRLDDGAEGWLPESHVSHPRPKIGGTPTGGGDNLRP